MLFFLVLLFYFLFFILKRKKLNLGNDLEMGYDTTYKDSKTYPLAYK
jgi:hypothetical protein